MSVEPLNDCFSGLARATRAQRDAYTRLWEEHPNSGIRPAADMCVGGVMCVYLRVNGNPVAVYLDPQGFEVRHAGGRWVRVGAPPVYDQLSLGA